MPDQKGRRCPRPRRALAREERCRETIVCWRVDEAARVGGLKHEPMNHVPVELIGAGPVSMVASSSVVKPLTRRRETGQRLVWGGYGQASASRPVIGRSAKYWQWACNALGRTRRPSHHSRRLWHAHHSFSQSAYAVRRWHLGSADSARVPVHARPLLALCCWPCLLAGPSH